EVGLVAPQRWQNPNTRDGTLRVMHALEWACAIRLRQINPAPAASAWDRAGRAQGWEGSWRHPGHGWAQARMVDHAAGPKRARALGGYRRWPRITGTGQECGDRRLGALATLRA